MIRFVLRLAGALLAESLCKWIKPTDKHAVFKQRDINAAYAARVQPFTRESVFN